MRHTVTVLSLLLVAYFGITSVTASPSGVPPVPTPGPNVRVINTAAQPVPVAQQGPLAISGTVGLAAGSSLTVANTPAAPMFVQSLATPRTPFQRTLHIVASAGDHASPMASFDVPTGSARLVIEEVSVAATDTTATMIGTIETTVAGQAAEHFLAAFQATTANTGRPLTVVQTRRIYADAGTTVSTHFDVPGSFAGFQAPTEFWVTVSGYLE